MKKLNRLGKILLFLALTVTLLGVCSVALADEHIGSHVWDSGTKISDANCEHPAKYRYTCTLCGAVQEEYVGASDPSKHDWGDWIIDKAPTCTEKGARHRECKNNVHHTGTDEPAALGHNFEWTVVTAPTCTSTGLRKQVCTRCGFENAAEVMEKLPHTPGNWETKTAPTCTTAGVQVRKCTVCGTEVDSAPLAALGHDWGNWETTKEPTCTAKGEQSRVCKRDSSHKETLELAALGHKWDNGTVTKEPTCTEKGVKTYVCQNDNSHVRTEEIPALNHKWDNGTVTKEPTCDDPGVKTFVCQNDSSHTKTEPIPALGHKWDKGTVKMKPTITTEGVMEYTCQNDPSHKKTEKIPKLTMSNNTVCAFGPRLRDVHLYDQWYMFTPFDASQDGVQTYELVATNRYIVGTVTLTIRDGELTVDYKLNSNTIDITLEFFTVLSEMDDIDRYEPEELLSMRMTKLRPINLEETFGSDRNLVLYFCSRCSYTYSNNFQGLNYNSDAHQKLLTKMLEMMD